MEGKRFGNFYFTKKIRDVYLGEEFRVIEIDNNSFKEFRKGLVLSNEIKFDEQELKSYFQLLKEKKLKNIVFGMEILKIKGKTIILTDYQKSKNLLEIIKKGKDTNNPISLDNALHIFMTVFDLALAFKNEFSSDEQKVYFFPNPDDILVNDDGAILYQYPVCNFFLGKGKGIEKILFKNFPYLIKSANVVDSKNEVFWFTALFYYLITGEKLNLNTNIDTAYIASKKLLSPYQTYRNIPEFIVPIIDKGVNGDYRSLGEMWKDFEEIIMDGDITPSTFNLAFYYNSLFKEEKSKEDISMEKEKQPPFPEDQFLLEKEKTEKFDKEIFSVMDEIEEKSGPNKGLILGIVGIIALVVVLIILVPKFINKPKTVVQPKVDINKLTQQIEKKLSEKYDQQIKQMQDDFQKRLAKVKDEATRKALLAEQQRRIAALKKQRQQEQQKTLAKVKQEIAKKSSQNKTEKPQVTTKEKTQTNKPVENTNQTKQPVNEQPVNKVSEEVKKKQDVPVVKPKIQEPIVREGDIVPINELDKPLKVLKKVSPTLTYSEAKLGSVRVIMQVLVNTDGKVEKFRIIKVIPQIAGLDARMRKVIFKWRFSIPTKKGIKVKTWKTIPMLIRK